MIKHAVYHGTMLLHNRRYLYLAAAGLLYLEEEEKRQHEQQEGLETEEETNPSRRKKARTMWIREWLARRHEFGHYDQLLTELHKEDPKAMHSRQRPRR